MNDPAFTIGDAGIPYLTIPGPTESCSWVSFDKQKLHCENKAEVLIASEHEDVACPACLPHWFDMHERFSWALTFRQGDPETWKPREGYKAIRVSYAGNVAEVIQANAHE